MMGLNNTIKQDRGLGEGFQIGHSYFCEISNRKQKDWFKSVVKYEIEPLLKEYFFDDLEKAENIVLNLTGE